MCMINIYKKREKYKTWHRHINGQLLCTSSLHGSSAVRSVIAVLEDEKINT